MPKDSSLKRIFVIGSGPIIIGQACEFDYSGTQALKAIRDEGIETILLNSNPATIMTDPDLATRTYIEPMTLEVCEAIIKRERPDAILPTMGGQTALNLAKDLAEAGTLERYGVKLLGASLDSIKMAEDRQLFKEAMLRIGIPTPRGQTVSTVEQALAALDEVGLPAILRPSFTLGGTGGGIARTREDFIALCTQGLEASPIGTVLVEESVLGWKEFELEVVRDRADNVVIVCSIENLDPMGVHTGDSITVAPAQTLTDREYQRLRDAAIAIVREIGVETGGANVQFAVNPADGRYIVVEMNPRVSRSSALASKATGYPIAKVATKLALGYTLDEITNDITKTTPASFEPSIDYVVVKIPRFDFEKFPDTRASLTTSMRSVGEVMAIGTTFRAAYMKAMRSLDGGKLALRGSYEKADLAEGRPDRPYALAAELRKGASVAHLALASGIDPFFLEQLRSLVLLESKLAACGTVAAIPMDLFRRAKQDGFSDRDIARAIGATEASVRTDRHARGLRPVYKRVDTCAGEFPAETSYLYATYDEDDEAAPTQREKVIILGSGPIRIGQGVEFDYACVHASMELQKLGYETIMVNCNPETVSTDFDTSDRLYFEAITTEDVLEIVHREKPLGVLLQLGGQTPLSIAGELAALGVPILGTSAAAIHWAEDRGEFSKVLSKLALVQPKSGTAHSLEQALGVAKAVGYPVVVRPSYVIGGRSMRVAHNPAELADYVRNALRVSDQHPLLVDAFLQQAIEVDIDLVRDSEGTVVVGGLLEHIEEAGVHSGDAACILPPHSLTPSMQERIRAAATQVAHELGVVGLMNAQFAVQGEALFVLEVNPRASRTVPFVAKATGVPLARLAAAAMVGRSIAGTHVAPCGMYAAKESVFPFRRFPGSDTKLGPEMRSTGEVMGLGATPAIAFGKASLAADCLPASLRAILFSLKPEQAQPLAELAREAAARGTIVYATQDTWVELKAASVPVVQASEHEIATLLKSQSLDAVVVTGESKTLRMQALDAGVAYVTTVQAASMLMQAISARQEGFGIVALQDLRSHRVHSEQAASSAKVVL
jgi:carbamoyl-phosphate synthase large subunit